MKKKHGRRQHLGVLLAAAVKGQNNRCGGKADIPFPFVVADARSAGREVA
jgi:hypothetical protein